MEMMENKGLVQINLLFKKKFQNIQFIMPPHEVFLIKEDFFVKYPATSL